MNQIQREEWTIAVDAAKKRASGDQKVNFLYPDTAPFKEAVIPMHESMLGQHPDFVPIYDAIQAYNQKYPSAES